MKTNAMQGIYSYYKNDITTVNIILLSAHRIPEIVEAV